MKRENLKDVEVARELFHYAEKLVEKIPKQENDYTNQKYNLARLGDTMREIETNARVMTIDRSRLDYVMKTMAEIERKVFAYDPYIAPEWIEV